MIVSLDIAKQEEKLKNIDDEKLKRKLKALEKAIRKYTNNKFLDTRIRFKGSIQNGKLISPISNYLKEGNNIELTHCLSDGPYTIKSIEGNAITLDDDNLIDCKHLVATKIVYPEDVQERCFKIARMEFWSRKKSRN